MKILGIDPGLRVTGYGVITSEKFAFGLLEAGVIRTGAKDGIAQRLATIHRGVASLLRDLKPDVIVLEKLFAHYKHPATSILMGHARGVICLASHEYDVPLVSFASTRVKKAVSSHGHATKQQVQRAVQGFLGLKAAPSPVDVSDALAVALTYGLTQGRLTDISASAAPRRKVRLTEGLEELADEFETGVKVG